jgi:hypothetical protein
LMKLCDWRQQRRRWEGLSTCDYCIDRVVVRKMLNISTTDGDD